MAGIGSALEPLRHFPLFGPARDHLAPGLWIVVHDGYAVYYQPLPDAIFIIRVLHGARDAAALAERGGFHV